MTINFTPNWPKRCGGGLTRFIEKVLQGLCDHDILSSSYYMYVGDDPPVPKLHTIRKGNRWKRGVQIHFKYWTGKPYRSKTYQFAPVIICEEAQSFSISYKEDDSGKTAYVFIDGQLVSDVSMNDENWECLNIGDFSIRQLAINDGFESVTQFFEWFNEDFEGQIIHWTKLRY